jgi:uncharacterized protein
MSIVLVGASVRAAAFSALRAGLRPWCADLFGDLDLKQRCPSVVVPVSGYPSSLVEVVAQAPPGPWIYTGALENRPAFVRQLAEARVLWGNAPHVLSVVRSPRRIHDILSSAGLPSPLVRSVEDTVPGQGRWLLKPQASAGGSGIRFWDGQPLPAEQAAKHYLQEFMEGPSWAALYRGRGDDADLVGVTAQLVGERWLNAAPFHYCGSVGPLSVSPALEQAFTRIGRTLAKASGLRGLFGVDCVMRDGTPWPVEVNPRYPASAEVHEYASGLPILALHRQAFEDAALPPHVVPAAQPVVGKAIYFAERTLTFPPDGPWMETLRRDRPIQQMPEFADIPAAGQIIEAARPVLSFFARAADDAKCRERLRAIAVDLDRRLGGG